MRDIDVFPPLLPPIQGGIESVLANLRAIDKPTVVFALGLNRDAVFLVCRSDINRNIQTNVVFAEASIPRGRTYACD